MDCCIASNVLQINQNKKKEMLIYSIAECTFVVVFSQHSGGMPVGLLLVGRHMLSYSILHDKNAEKQSQSNVTK